MKPARLSTCLKAAAIVGGLITLFPTNVSAQITTGAPGLSALVPVGPFIVRFDEDGHATIAVNGGAATILTGTLAPDPTVPAGAGQQLALTYMLPEPVVAGDVSFAEVAGAAPSDWLRFTDNAGNLTGATGAGPRMLFYSDVELGETNASLADTRLSDEPRVGKHARAARSGLGGKQRVRLSARGSRTRTITSTSGSATRSPNRRPMRSCWPASGRSVWLLGAGSNAKSSVDPRRASGCGSTTRDRLQTGPGPVLLSGSGLAFATGGDAVGPLRRPAPLQRRPSPSISSVRRTSPWRVHFFLSSEAVVLLAGLADRAPARRRRAVPRGVRPATNSFTLLRGTGSESGAERRASRTGSASARQAGGQQSVPGSAPAERRRRCARRARVPAVDAPMARARRVAEHDRPSSFAQSTMATLPGLPQTDEPEPDALPVEPDDGTTIAGCARPSLATCRSTRRRA